MAPRGDLFQHLSDLEKANSRERLLARQRLQQKRSGEILTTYMAFPLQAAQERMGEGMAIGDGVELRHVTTNEHDPNAIEVRWNNRWIGFIPRRLAALLVREIPELPAGIPAVITQLATTTQRDAFRLQLSIPIERASDGLKALSINAAFSWDFDRERGDDKLRLVVRCSEKDLRDLQAVLETVALISKCGYSYYPLADGRTFPWYLSLTARNDGPPPEEPQIEEQISQAFGVASESKRLQEREQRRQDQLQRLESIGQQLKASRLAEARLKRQVDQHKQALQQGQAKAERQTSQTIKEKSGVERQLKAMHSDLDVAMEELDLAQQSIVTLRLEKDELINEKEQLQEDNGYLLSQLERASGWTGAPPVSGSEADQDRQEALLERLVGEVQHAAASCTPRQILDLVDRLVPGSLLLLPTALSSADKVTGFELSEKLFAVVWKLATSYHQQRLLGAPDIVGRDVFGPKVWAARESKTTANNRLGKAQRTFTYKNKPLLMLQHLKIGVKDSTSRTLRLHFAWDPDDAVVVIGHCGEHLYVHGH